MKACFIAALLLIAGCAKHVTVDAPVIAPTYQYIRLSDGRYLITATNDAEAKKAVKQIGCICSVTETKIWIITPLQKP
jgi:hypothetical protein